VELPVFFFFILLIKFGVLIRYRSNFSAGLPSFSQEHRHTGHKN